MSERPAPLRVSGKRTRVTPVGLTLLASLGGFLSDPRMETLVPVGLATIAAFFMMSSLRRKQRRGAAPRRELEPKPGPPVTAELRRDMDDLMVELQELSRKISAEIDTRYAKLEAALRDADRRIAVLNRLARQADPGSPVSAATGSDADSRHTVVYELADAGFTPVEIARDLGRTPGEVELILNLRRKP